MEISKYLDNHKSVYHAVEFCKKVLEDAGFKELKLKDKFELKANDKYYIIQNGSSLFAFIMPGNIKSMRLAMAHTDFPTFKLKPMAKLNAKANCNQVNVEPYGGSLKKTWFDRALGIAGKLVIKTDDILVPKEILFDSEKPWLVIPSLAPHMDREIEKREIDAAKELNPLIGLMNQTDIISEIAKKTGINESDILSYDLNLYDTNKSELVGINNDYIQSGSLDNMASCAAIINAIVNADASEDVLNIAALFDNEEIGSRTKQGADSDLFKWIITKICLDSGKMQNESDIISMLSESIMLSCDGAHAVHPNYQEKADSSSIAELGKGIVIKTSSSQRYVTDATSIAIIKALCEKENIAYQMQANKSGTPGGQTLGPIASSYLPIKAVDMGIPMLAMHSIRELAAYKDYSDFEKVLTAFYNL